MKIAFNPSTVEALIAPPNNKDITFDLRGHNIFARGVKFCGTDTNTWRDIKINNVSIDSNTLDLRDGSNTTLTNINGVVTINSTWRPVVDNLTSDSITSSLSANQGRILVGLINGKSDSEHNHDDRYLRLTGGTLTGDLYINTNLYGPVRGNNPRNRYDAALYFFNCNSSTTSTYNFGLYQWNDEFQFTYRTSADNLWKGNSFTIQGSDGQVTFDKTPKVGSALISLNGHTHAYLPLSGGWMSGDINFGGDNKIYWGRNTDSASISFKNDGDGDDDSYMSFVTSDNGNEYFRWSHSSGSTNTEWMALRSDGLRVGGTKVSLEGHSHNDLYYTKTEVNNKLNDKSDSGHNHDDRYVKKTGDTMFGALNFANGTWNLVGDDSYMGDCNISGHVGIKAANTTYPGISFFNNANAHLGNLTAYSGNIKYGAYSLQFLDNGNTSVSASTWTNPFSSYNSNAVADGQAICVWGQSSQLSNLATDTGDMSLWLKRVNSNVATLNMVLDGEYYANGNQRLAHVSEIPNSLKNPYALTISLNGTSQGPYDGSAAKNINITPSSIGAATSDHNHDGRYVRYYAVTTLDCNNLAPGLTTIRNTATNSAVVNHSAFLYISDVGTPFQIQIPDSNTPYIFKRSYSSGEWSGWFKLNAGYADSAGSASNLTVHQYLSNTDTTWWPLIWGGSSHNNTSDSTGEVYKSHDVLSWQTSSQTLYATNIQTENIKHLSIGGGIYWNPYVESASDDSDSASITLVKSGVAGGTTLVLSQMNDSNDTIQFQTNGSARLYHNSYPILTTQNTYVSNNKGYINGTEITQVNNADTVDGVHANQLCRIYTFNVHDSIIKVGTLTSGQYGHVCKLRFNSGIGYNAGNQDKTMTVVIRASNGGANSNGFYFEAHSESYRGGAFTTFYLHQTSKTQCELYMSAFNYSGQSTYEVSFSAGDSWTNEISVQNALPTSNIFTLPNYQIAYTDYNVASATKLATARTIWGQSFDGTANVDNTLRIRQTTGNYCEGIRIQNGDNTWATIILGATGDSGTNANAWSIHRKDDNNFAISRNSADGTNGLVMTSVGMGLGTTAPTQRLDVAGNIRTTGNLYISHVTNNNMNYNTSNPRIVFSESGSQAVGLVYTDYDSYRASKGLKVMDVDNDDTGNVWFEVQGYNYSSGYVKNGSSDSYVLLGGGGHKLESSLNVASASVASKVYGQVGDTGSHELVRCDMNNDQFRIIAGSNGNNNGWAEIATADDGNEPIYVRQYTGVFSSVRRTLTLLDESGNTTFPGSLSIGGQIIRGGYSALWIYGRDVALLRETIASGYHTLWSLKTTNGSWDFGEYTTSGLYNIPILSYITDSNYNSGNNVVTYQIKFPLASGTVALTSYGGDNSHPIFLGYLNLDHGSDGTVSSSFYCLGYSVPFTYTRGGNYCRISIPDTSYQVFYIRAAIASVNYSGGGMDTWTGYRRGAGAWWLHCYVSGLNEVRVKGFRQANDNNDSWWGGNPLVSDNSGANRITVCIFGNVTFR